MTKALKYGAYAVALLVVAVILSHLHTHTQWINETLTVASIFASFGAVWPAVQLMRAARRGPRRSDG